MRRLELMDLPLSVGEKHAATGSGASARLAPGRWSFQEGSRTSSR